MEHEAKKFTTRISNAKPFDCVLISRRRNSLVSFRTARSMLVVSAAETWKINYVFLTKKKDTNTFDNFEIFNFVKNKIELKECNIMAGDQDCIKYKKFFEDYTITSCCKRYTNILATRKSLFNYPFINHSILPCWLQMS